LNADNMPGTIPAGSAITTWNYDPASGLMLSKRDAANKGADYQYDIASRLTERKWARSTGGNRITTKYAYNGFSQLTTTTYSDGTPNAAITYDRLGRTSSVGNGIAESIYAYHPATLLPTTETIRYDLDRNGTYEFTRVLDRSRDTLGRDTGFQLKGSVGVPPASFVESSVTYGYSQTDGRLLTVADASSGSFTYSYLPSSNLLASVTGPAHTVTNTWEPDRDVLDLKQNKVGTSVISQYDYTVNAIGQRTNLSQTGSAFSSARSTAWAYDSLGQVTRADSSIPGLDRAYQFDMIGNRLKTADSLTLPASNNYTANALNQYTAVNSVNPVHDLDGNMTSGPLPANINANSTLVWDAENRLIQATVPGGSIVNFTYDAQSRRIAEKVGTTTKITVYDAWNPIAEYSGSVGVSPALQKTYIWGIDLSGTMQGAGGVGGLLAVTDSTVTYFPTFDGNGNVSEYLNSAGSVVAHYEYDPFGRTTVATGSKAQDFSHRFSTKPLDATTGLYYYGYRFYDPATGRWPSRDPIGERGGLNLYGFVGNNGINKVDYFGLFGGTGIGGPQIPGWNAPRPPRPPLHADNQNLDDWFDDPGPSCFNEGWLRHCILSCRLQHRTGAGWLTQLGAQFSGNDLPWQATRDQGDVNANQQGINNANNNGPGDSCVDRCTQQWWQKVRDECCELDASFTKDSNECCELNQDFNNYRGGGA
jgi:RHS repeat-associated protein